MLKENQITIISKKPGKKAEMELLFDNTLEAMQEFVGGPIEAVTLFSDVAIICNEEGRLRGMKPSATLCGYQFVGPILMVGVKGDEFCSLKGDHLTLLLSMFGGEQ